MSWIDILGYIASLFVFAAFCIKTMIPLRLVAIASNIAFIAWAFLGGIYPALILHLALLPMNIWRTIQMIRLVRKVETAAKGDLSIDWLKPFMKSIRYRAGDILFRRNDEADRLFYIVEGNLLLEEIDHTIGPGELLGEIALFSADRRRTQTARCLADVELLWVTEGELAQLCYQNPAVSFHLLRLITNRLMANQMRPRTARGPASSVIAS